VAAAWAMIRMAGQLDDFLGLGQPRRDAPRDHSEGHRSGIKSIARIGGGFIIAILAVGFGQAWQWFSSVSIQLFQ